MTEKKACFRKISNTTEIIIKKCICQLLECRNDLDKNKVVIDTNFNVPVLTETNNVVNFSNGKSELNDTRCFDK